MQLNTILSRLDGLKSTGNGKYQAKCPCHDDRHASLSISENSGKILMHCHAGCEISDICNALGITTADLFGEPPTQWSGGGNAQMREVKRYVYTDENGTPLHATIRYEPKTFRQVSLNPNGSVREWTVKNVQTVLYNLPNVLRAETVYLVEGEKDVDLLNSLGFTATTSPMGAGKWKQNYTETLRGKNVIIIPDNDTAGQKHAEIVRNALKGTANSVKVAQLLGLPNKGDVSDYLGKANSLEEAQHLILTLPTAENTQDFDCFDYGQGNQTNQKVELSDHSDIAFADAFSYHYGNISRYCCSLGWLVWDGKKWEANDLKAQGLEVGFTDIIRGQALRSGDSEYIKFATRMRGFSRVQGVLGIAKSHLEISSDLLDNNPCDLNTPDGIVDLKTGRMRPHDPNAFCTKMTAVSPKNERNAMFEKFLYDITLGSTELMQYIQCVAGMALLGKVYSEVLILAYGTGHNGKSTLFNTLYEILGDYSGKIPAEALTTRAKNVKNDVAELFGKRFVIAAETEEGNRLSTGMLKQIASTDPLTAEKKYRDPFVFTPTHSLILYTNHLPKVGSDDLGTWRRLVPVPFSAKIENPQLDFAEKLIENAGGEILNWCIQGAMYFIKNGYKLPNCSAVENAKSEYKADNDWLSQFLEECCTIAAHEAESGSKLYERYSEWCVKSGEYKRCNRDFAKALESRGFEKKKGMRGNSWHGVCLLRDY
jgi:P4 family phage/plasmid primase-like protien